MVQQIQLMAILEQLAESDERNALLQRVKDELDNTEGPASMSLIEGVNNDLLHAQISLRQESRDQLNKWLDSAFERLKENKKAFMLSDELTKVLEASVLPNSDKATCFKLRRFLIDEQKQLSAFFFIRFTTLACDSFWQQMTTAGSARANAFFMEALKTMLICARGTEIMPRELEITVDMLCRVLKNAHQQADETAEMNELCFKVLNALRVRGQSNQQKVNSSVLIPLLEEARQLFSKNYSALNEMTLAKLGDESFARERPGEYLALVKSFGSRNLNAEAERVLVDLLKSEKFDIVESSTRGKDEARNLVSRAINSNLYYQMAFKHKFNCSLSQEDVSLSLQQALIAI